MNRDMMQGNWKSIKGQIQSKWGKLQNEDIEFAQGKFESLVGALQRRYGFAKDRAERELDDFIRTIGQDVPPAHIAEQPPKPMHPKL